MIKKLLVVLFIIVGAISTALAGHDGPFPMFRAEGTWASQNVPGLYVTIKTDGPAQNDGVYVLVEMENSQGQIIAEGRDFHRFNDPLLNVTLTTVTGKHILVTLSPLKQSASDQDNMELVMHVRSISYQGGVQEGETYILGK